MPDLSQPVPVSFIVGTVLLVFVIVGLGIAVVLRAKKVKEDA
jgi:hypothetical protein